MSRRGKRNFGTKKGRKENTVGRKLVEKSRIQETKHLSTDADNSTDTQKILVVRQNLSKKKKQIKLIFLHGDLTHTRFQI